VPTLSDEGTNYGFLGLNNMKNQNRYHVQGFVCLFPLFYAFLKYNLVDTMLNTLIMKRVRVNTHAKLRKNKSKLDGKITSRGFTCSKEGVRRVDKQNHLYNCHQNKVRTECVVWLHVSLVRETGKYKVYDFVVEHNHFLHLEETIYMMRSHRKMSEVQASEIDLAYASGISPKATHALMIREAGGRENLGYTELDQKNYIRTKRQKNLMYGEAASLLKYFQEQITKNLAFHYAVQLDNEEKITNIFWVDARMIADYVYFGDMMTFDTTFGTNK